MSCGGPARPGSLQQTQRRRKYWDSQRCKRKPHFNRAQILASCLAESEARTCTLAPGVSAGRVGNCPPRVRAGRAWHTWAPARSLFCQDPSRHLLPPEVPSCGSPSLNGVRGKTCQASTTHPLTSQILLPEVTSSPRQPLILATVKERGEMEPELPPPANSGAFSSSADPKSPPRPGSPPKSPLPLSALQSALGASACLAAGLGYHSPQKTVAKAAEKGGIPPRREHGLLCHLLICCVPQPTPTSR